MFSLSNQTIFVSNDVGDIQTEIDQVSCPVIESISQNAIQKLHSQFFNNNTSSDDTNTIYEDDMFLPGLLSKYRTQYSSIVENNTDWLMSEACEASLERYANLVRSFQDLVAHVNDSGSTNTLKAKSIRGFLFDVLQFTRVDYVVLMCSWYRYYMWWRPSSYLISPTYHMYEIKVRNLIGKCNLTSFSGREFKRGEKVDINNADNDSNHNGEEEHDNDHDDYETTMAGLVKYLAFCSFLFLRPIRDV